MRIPASSPSVYGEEERKRRKVYQIKFRQRIFFRNLIFLFRVRLNFHLLFVGIPWKVLNIKFCSMLRESRRYAQCTEEERFLFTILQLPELLSSTKALQWCMATFRERATCCLAFFLREHVEWKNLHKLFSYVVTMAMYTCVIIHTLYCALHMKGSTL